MSFAGFPPGPPPPPPGSAADPEMERRMQEEYRRRQQMQGPYPGYDQPPPYYGAPPPPPPGGGRSHYYGGGTTEGGGGTPVPTTTSNVSNSGGASGATLAPGADAARMYEQQRPQYVYDARYGYGIPPPPPPPPHHMYREPYPTSANSGAASDPHMLPPGVTASMLADMETVLNAPKRLPPGPKPRSLPKTPSAAKQKRDAIPKRRMVGRMVEDELNPEIRYWTGAVPLGLDDDKYWLSELQVFLRANFAEVFAATEEDIAAPMHGRNKPIALGQVGVRCIHCKQRGQQATSYPSLISGIYNSVQQMLRLHLDCCMSMPLETRQKIEQLKLSCSSRGGRKQYWVDSARRLGLVDTEHGIQFGRDPFGPLPPLTGPSVNSREGRRKKATTTSTVPAATPLVAKSKQAAVEAAANYDMEPIGSTDSPPDYEARSDMIDGGIDPDDDLAMNPDSPGDHDAVLNPSVMTEFPETAEKPGKKKSPKTPKEPKVRGGKKAAAAAKMETPIVDEMEDEEPLPPVDTRPLVFPEDKPLISDYLYLTLEQMAPCLLMEADRVGCYKTRKVGFPGLACKHCVGQAGCGRYFPASEASLSQTTTSQTIMNHVRNCRRCPLEIRESLEIMKRSKLGSDRKRQSSKPKHGGRKVFFHRLWCRIQGLPFEEGRAETKDSKRSPRKTGSSRKRRKARDDDSMSGSESGSGVYSDESGMGSEIESDDPDSKPRAKGKKGAADYKSPPWFDGCVRLTKTDDPHWLSEMECFARSELVEVFSYRKGDSLEGYSGRKKPSVGQVGIRCVYCKTADAEDRSNGCISFPDSLSSIHTKIGDMVRLHFPTCPSIYDDARETFRSLRGYDAKVADDDSQQYWVDSARDIGLSNVPPMSRGDTGWGVTFRRDPLQPSPADELDLEDADEDSASYSKNVLVKPSDRGLCTDQVILLLRQVRPCQFKKADRRAGPGSRGRERDIGFPGLACLHCAGKTTLGRYFPVSAKNLTDNTVNSLASHVASCSRCPEPIRASLAYLGHRSILQKAELSGSWKKAYFKKIWDRLHAERDWAEVDDDVSGELSSDDEGKQYAEGEDGEERGSDEDEDKEELGENMNALIKAAAIWLTEQDQANDSGKSGRGKTRAAKRTGTRAASSLPTKRRRDGN